MTGSGVVIVLVNWNGHKDTVECLTSLAKCKKKDVPFTPIVVDNASQPQSVRYIKKHHPWVTVLVQKENLGFAAGVNVGIRYALRSHAQYVWLLNNDTILDSDALTLSSAFSNAKVGGATSKIYFFKGREYHYQRYSENERGNVIWYAGGVIDWQTMIASHRGVDEVDRGQYDRVEPTEFITGCSFMIRTDIVDKIGFFDEKYFLYLEDLDFSLRMKRAGYTLLYVPSSRLWHKNAGSTQGAGSKLHEYYMTRNRLYLGMKYAPVRTKMALGREALKFLITGPESKKRAVADWMLGRYQKRYERE